MPTYNYIIAVFLCFYTCYPHTVTLSQVQVSVLAMAMQLRSFRADKLLWGLREYSYTGNKYYLWFLMMKYIFLININKILVNIFQCFLIIPISCCTCHGHHCIFVMCQLCFWHSTNKSQSNYLCNLVKNDFCMFIFLGNNAHGPYFMLHFILNFQYTMYTFKYFHECTLQQKK